MADYDWPSEPLNSSDLLMPRAEHQLHLRTKGAVPGISGELDDLNDVIDAIDVEARRWLPLGPSLLLKGQATGEPIVSGRVRAVRASADGSRIYVGAANGGVWYSSDSGATWTPVGAGGLAAATERSGLSLTIGDVLVEFDERPGVAKHNDEVYVATGEASPYVSNSPGGKFGGMGVLRLSVAIEDAIADRGGNPWQREASNLSNAGIYRLARDPDNPGTMVAAASTGLWRRTGGFVADADWDKISSSPFNFDANESAAVGDVLWTKDGLWVALHWSSGNSGLWRSPSGDADDFQSITLPKYDGFTRLSIAASPLANPGDNQRIYVISKLEKSFTTPSEHRGHAALWQVDLSHRTRDAFQVDDFPIMLFAAQLKGSGTSTYWTKDQADYDQALTIGRSSTGKDIVYAGGLGVFTTDWNASIFKLEISGRAQDGDLSAGFSNANAHRAHTDPAKWIGNGIHSDVHSLTLVGEEVLVGCDGGVYKVDATNTSHALNAGLVTSQPGYCASFASLDGPMVAGLQDNGTIKRIGNTVWQLIALGDGGGCGFHPDWPHMVFRQYIRASWDFLPERLPNAPGLRETGNDDENDRSQFYSQPAVLQGEDNDHGRVFLGTDRIWFCNNWRLSDNSVSWVTLPTSTDPWDSGKSKLDFSQDRLKIGKTPDPVNVIEVLKAPADRSKVDGMALLVLCKDSVRIFRCDNNGVWSSMDTSIVSGDREKQKKADAANPSLDYLPKWSGSAWTDIAVHDARQEGHETFYVATTGAVETKDNGSLLGVTNYDVLWWYNGHGKWFPTGLRNAPLDKVAGTGGDPSAVTSIVVDPGEPGDPNDAGYPGDRPVIYAGNRLGVWRGELTLTGTGASAVPSWSWRPAMEGLPQTIVEDLHVYPPEGGAQRYLRAALVSRGIWERDISETPSSVGRLFMRTVDYDTGRGVLPSSLRSAENGATLGLFSSPDIKIGTGTIGMASTPIPNEAEMREQSDLITGAILPVYLMGHYGHTTPLDPTQVNFDLFAQEFSWTSDTEDPFTIDDQWRNAIRGKVTGGSPTMPNFLRHLGRGQPNLALDATHSRATRMMIDFQPFFTIPPRAPNVMLIAVITSPNHSLPNNDLEHPTAGEIVRHSHQIAMRAFDIGIPASILHPNVA